MGVSNRQHEASNKDLSWWHWWDTCDDRDKESIWACMIPLIGTCQQRSGAWFLWGILLSSLLFYFTDMVDCDKCNSTKSLPSKGKLCPHQI